MGIRRAPLVTVKSDDFEIVDGDETYYPHAGEVVVFRRRVSARDLMSIARASKMQEEDSDDESATERLAGFFHDEACVILGRAIHSWTWTDPYSEDQENPEPYGKPNAEALRGIDAMSELQYLLEKWLDIASPGEEKN